MDQISLRHKKNTAPPRGGAPAAPQLSGGGVPNSAMAEAIGGNYQSNMSGLEANMNQRMQAIQHPAAGAGVVQQSVPLGTVQMRPEEEQAAPAQEEDIPFWINPFLYIRNKWRKYKAQKAQKALQNAKRPWDMTPEDLAKNEFNPGDRDDVAKVQSKIDKAETPEEAFKALAGKKAQFRYESDQARDALDMGQFKVRMKNMARMMSDYPELKGLVTHMQIKEKKEGNEIQTTGKEKKLEAMAAGMMSHYLDGTNALFGSLISYTADNGELDREERASGLSKAEINTPSAMAGTHELGHILAGHMAGLKNQEKGFGYTLRREEEGGRYVSNSMLKKVIRKMIQPRKLHKIKNSAGQQVDMRPKKQRMGENYHRLAPDIDPKEMIDLNKSGLGEGFTSHYGHKNPAEFFAEAFADVYTHGNKAKRYSIKLVQEYERRRDKLMRRIKDNKMPR